MTHFNSSSGKSCQQALAGFGRLVIDPDVETVPVGKTRIGEDSQVAADPALLLADDQAEVADAQLAGLIQQLHQLQPSGIAQGLSLPRQTGCFLGIGQLRTQSLDFPWRRVFQAQIGVSHG